MWRKLLDALPRGHYLAEEDWQRRHRLMLWILGLHAPALVGAGLLLGYTPRTLALVAIAPLALVGLGHLLRHYRRAASVTVTIGLVYCSAALVVLTHGAIEAHFHFFVIIGFIALYQDWAPFLCNIVFTVISHGIGSVWQKNLIFEHAPGQANPWIWSGIHGVAVLVACAGALLVLRVTEDTQRDKDVLARRLADSEINRRQFTSDLLTNLARRNQSLLHRQLEIINQLEETERDPDALADLFALDHIATRVRRNAENLLVLSGDQPPRTWSEPVALRDVLRAAIAETENLERVVFVVDEQSAVVGHTVIDLTHLLAELTENAVRFSPPDTTVTVRSRPDRARPGGRLITIEDWGLGLPADQIEEANVLLATPPDIDMAVSQRLGFHVVARLAARHGIKVGLSVTPGSGTTALVSLPPSLFATLHPTSVASAPPFRAPAAREPSGRPAPPVEAAPPRDTVPADWGGWWDPAVASAMPAFNPTATANGAASAGATAVNGHGTNGHSAPRTDGDAPRPATGPNGGPRPTSQQATNGFAPVDPPRGDPAPTDNGPIVSRPIDSGPLGAALFGGNRTVSTASDSDPSTTGAAGMTSFDVGADQRGLGQGGAGASGMGRGVNSPGDSGPIDIGPLGAALFGSPAASTVDNSGPNSNDPSSPAGIGADQSGPIAAGQGGTGPLDSGPIGISPVGSGPLGSGPLESGPIGIGPLSSGAIAAGPIGTGSIGTGPVGGGPVGISPVGISPTTTDQRDNGTLDRGPIGTGPLSSGAIAAGPVGTGPVSTGPVSTGPVSTGPVSTGPVGTGPLSSGAIAVGPVGTGPVGIGPIVMGQGDVRPSDSGPIAVGPRDAGPSYSGPIGIVSNDSGPIGLVPNSGPIGIVATNSGGEDVVVARGEGGGLKPGTSTPTYRMTTAAARMDRARRPSPTPHPVVVDAPPVAVATVPDPRDPGTIDPASGLRRRIPQAHLSAQLRSPEPEDPPPAFHRPSTAEAAAALSRYQASRAAAQARMDDALPRDPATTTHDPADGGHA